MSALALVEGLPHLDSRAPNARPAPIPDARLNWLLEGEIVGVERRAPDSASTSSAAAAGFSCGPHNTSSYCQKPVDGTSNTTIPIALGVLLPLTIALLIFAVLHRRHVKKLRQEDLNDAHKSLDFGIMEPEGMKGKGKGKGKGKKGRREMSMAETKDTVRRGRGLSMDLSEGNPYLLPPGLHQSRGSIHSLSRAVSSEDDPYARAISYVPGDGTGSYPSSVRRGPDDASIFTGSSRRTAFTDADSSQNLIRQGNRMSSSGASITSPHDPYQGQSQKGLVKPFTPPIRNGSLAPASPEPLRDSFVSTASSNGANTALRASNNYLGAFIRGGFLSGEEQKQKGETPTPATKSPKPTEPENLSNDTVQHRQPQSSDRSPTLAQGEPQPGLRYAYTLPEISVGDESGIRHEPTLPQLDLAVEADFDHETEYDHRRSTADIRPLPPDDPSENPEQRANRIRSFYKEYFEETKPGSKADHQSYYDGSEEYNYAHDQAYDPAYDRAYDPAHDEGYDESYDPGYYYDQYPVGEDYARSMTPPPRGPPRFMGTAHKPRSMSSGSFIPERSQVYSSASGRSGSAIGGMQAQKKNLPPPKALHVLPTPHLLKDDVILPIDFAPPSRSRERRAGTPDSLRGGLRPYSPAVAAHLPLASSFEELAAMPSP
jgi:hypothetical protein